MLQVAEILYYLIGVLALTVLHFHQENIFFMIGLSQQIEVIISVGKNLYQDHSTNTFYNDLKDYCGVSFDGDSWTGVTKSFLIPIEAGYKYDIHVRIYERDSNSDEVADIKFSFTYDLVKDQWDYSAPQSGSLSGNWTSPITEMKVDGFGEDYRSSYIFNSYFDSIRGDVQLFFYPSMIIPDS